VSVHRQILTSVEGSLLSLMFSGRWDDSTWKDKDGNFLIDFPPDLVLPMINYLRLKVIESSKLAVFPPNIDDFGGHQNKYANFKSLMEYYGMTHEVFPTKVLWLAGPCTQLPIQTGHPYSLHFSTVEFSSFALYSHGHSRKIISFEVTIGNAEIVRVGWMPNANRSTQSTFKFPNVHQSTQSPFLTVNQNGLSLEVKPADSCRFLVTPICFKDVTPLDFVLEKGAVIRCTQDQTKSFDFFVQVRWFVNDNEIHYVRKCNGTRNSYNESECINHKTWAYWKCDLTPAFAGKGEWFVSNIEFDE
jgi:hypothetical protein